MGEQLELRRDAGLADGDESGLCVQRVVSRGAGYGSGRGYHLHGAVDGERVHRYL